MVEDLLERLLEHKVQMEFVHSDFNAEKSKQYETVRVILSSKCRDDIGPIRIKAIEADEDHDTNFERCEDENIKIRKGYSKVLRKIKSFRQKFSTAVTPGRRSGSGKIVMEFYDKMVLIWDGAP